MKQKKNAPCHNNPLQAIFDIIGADVAKNPIELCGVVDAVGVFACKHNYRLLAEQCDVFHDNLNVKSK